ncbi:uncharacterized protein LOC109887372 isoform X8 [Oncorhynchus kisutch]|uniref:uncharacterized protein LOC109887372 isoform X8 n=1 Tax=Oncorhynchus kisutch TaxID=8019 RepID=UPI0012DC863E|nr:uncharacterized protein LOC109887372 isoform X8 [Oncorhynchus kisutch]
MDPSKEVAASVKDRMPAGEESEEPSSELPSTSSGMLTESVEEHDLETKISMLEKKLGFMKKSFMLDVPALLLTSLEELTEEQLKKFQSSGSICVFPLIPESQLENTDRQDTVVQMVKRYGPEGAVRNTLKILRRIKRDDVAQKLERDHTRAATWRRDSSDSDTWRRRKKHEAMRKKKKKKKKKEKRSFMLDVPALLLTGLEELTEEQLKIFQISLTTVQLPDFPPIPESQLENTDRQNTVDQMVKRYGPEGAVRNTWRILRRMNLDDLAEKLERYYSRGIPTKDYKSLVHPRPKSSLSHLYNAIHPSPSSSSSILPSGSSKELLSLTTGSSGQLSSQKTLDGSSLLLTSLEEMNPHELNRAWLPGSPLIPESQLENTDRQVTVDQMMKRYDPEEAMRIPFGNLKWRKRVDLAEKLERYHTRGIPTKDYKSLVQPRPFYSSLPTRFSSSSSFLPSGSSKELLSLTTGSSGQLSSQRHQILAVPALLLTTLEELTEEQLKTFQFYLTSGRMLDFPPIPERHLDNTDRQVTVDQIVKRYDHEGAVRNTLKILRRMNLDDLAEKLQRDHIRAVSTTETKWWSDSSDTGNDEEREKKHVHLSRRSRALDREAAGSKDTGITKDRYELVTKPTEKKIEALLLATLEELSTDELKILQQELTPSKQLPPYLTGFPPIPKTQLENNDRQLIVDQMLKRYGPEGVVEITLRILRRMNREDLAEKFERYHGRGKKKRTSEEPSWPGLVSRGEKIEEHCVPFLGRAPFLIKLKKTPKLEMDFSTIPGSQLEMANSLNTEVSVNTQENTQENTQRIDDEELRSENDSPPFLDHHHMSSPEEFTPEIHDQDNRGEYRFQCPSAGLFQCSITGLVFRMEGEGEVLYRTVHWDMRLLSQRGKRPAGPLFMFTCLKGSVCQLHLPHCEIYNSGGCDFLSVAHVTDDDIIEFLPPLETTETHVIINISGFSAYGEVKDEDSPTVPIRALVLLFYKPPVVPKKRSILNVLLLPRNVVIREVQEEWKRRNGDKYIYIETNPRCQLTPNKEYELFTDLTDEYLIQPKDAEFVDFESYENYFPTFQLFIQTVVEQVNLLLKDNGGEESVWDRLVWLPASPTDVPSTVSAVSPADPPANPSAPPGRAFIRRHRMALETRLGLLQPIFLRLQYHGVLIHEEREEVVSKSTKTLQNQTLLDMVVKKGARAQEHFYQVLKEVDPCLVEDLEEQTV